MRFEKILHYAKLHYSKPQYTRTYCSVLLKVTLLGLIYGLINSMHDDDPAIDMVLAQQNVNTGKQ